MANKSTRSQRRHDNQAMEIIVGCFGVLGMLSAILPQAAESSFGLMLLGGGFLMGFLHVIGSVRRGENISWSILRVLAVAVLAYSLTYGVIWYFTQYLAAQDVFKFSAE